VTTLCKWDIRLDPAALIFRSRISSQSGRRTRAVEDAIDRAFGVATKLIQPRVALAYRSTTRLTHERLYLDGDACLTGPLIAEVLGGTQGVTAVVCTIGTGLDTECSSSFASDPVYGWAVDEAGTLAVTALVDRVYAYVCESAARDGNKTTAQVSPGLVGWPLGIGQREVFGILGSRPAGVMVDRYGQMTPRKSISFVVGHGESVQNTGTTCDHCSLNERCSYSEQYA
jgi:hypothetical protein